MDVPPGPGDANGMLIWHVGRLRAGIAIDLAAEVLMVLPCSPSCSKYCYLQTVYADGFSFASLVNSEEF